MAKKVTNPSLNELLHIDIRLFNHTRLISSFLPQVVIYIESRGSIISDRDVITITNEIRERSVSIVMEAMKYVEPDAISIVDHVTFKRDCEIPVIRMMFRNHYVCYQCANRWTNEWPASCDDDCPECGARHITPHLSEIVR